MVADQTPPVFTPPRTWCCSPKPDNAGAAARHHGHRQLRSGPGGYLRAAAGHAPAGGPHERGLPRLGRQRQHQHLLLRRLGLSVATGAGRRNLDPRESNRYWRSVASSADGTRLVAVATGGQIYTSTDSGTNWTARESNRYWWSVASSADGTKLVAVVIWRPDLHLDRLRHELDRARRATGLGIPSPRRRMAPGWSRWTQSAARFTPRPTPG